MNGLSIIIPSRSITNLLPCIQAIHDHEPDPKIIVADDGVDWGFPHESEIIGPVRIDRLPISVVRGVKPFIFARNVNLGIRAAGDDDIIILGDDGLLQTPNGFTLLQQAAYANPEYGIISSSCNNVGNPNQLRRPSGSLRPEPRTVCFVCVIWPRSVINTIGLMDERFGGLDECGEVIYGFCDDDICLRARNAGYKLGVFDGCYVDHVTLPSEFRSQGPRSLDPGMRQFIRKWHVDNWGHDREHSAWRLCF